MAMRVMTSCLPPRIWASVRCLALRYASSSRSEEHTSELQSHVNLVCRLLLEKKKRKREEWRGSHRCYRSRGLRSHGGGRRPVRCVRQTGRDSWRRVGTCKVVARGSVGGVTA